MCTQRSYSRHNSTNIYIILNKNFQDYFQQKLETDKHCMYNIVLIKIFWNYKLYIFLIHRNDIIL